MSHFGSKEFYFEVAKGNIAGHSHINKFGSNPTAGAGDDIWGGGGVYPFYPTAGVLVNVVSTVDSDNGATATGALELAVQGLDENWNYIEELVTMDGTTPVATMTTTFIRLFRAFVRISGSSETNNGDVTVYARATGSGVNAGDVGAFLNAGAGQTQQTTYTIPAGKTAYFIKGYVGISTSAKTAENGVIRWMLKVNAFGAGGAWLVQGEIGVVNLGSSTFQYEYGVPAGGIPEKTDMKMSVIEASSTLEAVGGYDLILVDN